MPAHVRILLADDHAIVRKGIRDFLEEDRDLTVVAEATNGEEALRLGASICQMSRCSTFRCPFSMASRQPPPDQGRTARRAGACVDGVRGRSIHLRAAACRG